MSKLNNYKLRFGKTITQWDEAIPLGNGDLGCLIWGKATSLRFSIDKAGIWDCSNSPEKQEGFNYANLKSLVQRRKQRKINKIFDECYSNTTPTKLPTGRLIINLGVEDKVVSQLDILNAEAQISVGDITIKSFIHSTDDYGLISINRDVVCRLEAPQFGIKGKTRIKRFSKGISQSLLNLRYDVVKYDSVIKDSVQYDYFIQPTNDGEFGIFLAKKSIDGGTLITYTVESTTEGKNILDSAFNTLNRAITTEYNKAFESHQQWWKKYFEKSSITIEDKYLQNCWYLNNYYLASCSRKGKLPMPLQGVWTADNGNLPPWKGDYHHDLNTQMSYTSYLKANHLDEGESYIDYLISLTQRGEQFAREFYGVDGLCLPSVMDVKGYALGGWAQYSLSPTNQLWLALIIARHYHFTGNIEFLKNKVYPYFSKVGKFIISLLQEVNGYYRLPLSSSPEINDNRLNAWLTPNSNYDLALIRAFMTEAANLCELMGDTAEKAEWEKRFAKTESLAVNENGVLKISKDMDLTVSHRHLSHCMAIYPLRTMLYKGDNKRIIDNTINDIEKLGKKYWVGYTLGWLANMYTIQKQGDKAYALIKEFFECFCTDNGFHVNGDYKDKTDCGMKYRYFTLEGNFLATDVINNMLFYSERDGLYLFPAVPKEWKDASFNNLRGFGGILVSAVMKNGMIFKLTIKAENDVMIKILNEYNSSNAPKTNIQLKSGESYIWQANEVE